MRVNFEKKVMYRRGFFKFCPEIFLNGRLMRVLRLEELDKLIDSVFALEEKIIVRGKLLFLKKKINLRVFLVDHGF